MIIGFDMDEVLADLLGPLILFHNNEYGTSLTKQSFTSYSLAEAAGCTLDESTERICKFFRSTYFYNVNPIQDSQEGVAVIVDRYGKQPIITARPDIITSETIDWAHSHYPEMFSSVNLTNQWHGEGTERRKSQVCKELGVDIMIDDSPSHAYDCADEEIDVLIFGNYRWNQNVDQHPKIVRVPSMPEAFEWIKRNEGKYEKRR